MFSSGWKLFRGGVHMRTNRKNEKGLVKKWPKVSIYEIGKMESYLSDMAKEGLVLKEIHNFYLLFEKTEPMELEYRLEFGARKGFDKYVAMYQEAGWQYVSSIKGVYVFCTTASEKLVEMHTDPSEQSYTMKEHAKLLLTVGIIQTLLLCTMLGLTIFGVNIGKTPYLNVLGDTFIFIMQVLLYVWLTVQVMVQVKQFLLVKRRLRIGYEYNHHEKWQKTKMKIGIEFAIYGICILVSVSTYIYTTEQMIGSVTGRDQLELTLESEVPVVRLNEIEKLEKPEILIHDKESHYDESYVHVTKNMFLDEVEVNEKFHQEDMTWENETYCPSLESYYYEVKLPFMVNGVLSDVLYKVKEYFDADLDMAIVIEESGYPGLDKVYRIIMKNCEDSEHYFGIVVQKENKVLQMIYMGQKTWKEVVEASEKVLDK